MSNGEPGSSRRAQRTAQIHVGGSCQLRCPVCDCDSRASSERDVAQALTGGGARLVIRGATEASHAVASLVERGRNEGFADIVLRTNAIACREPTAALALARTGADAVVVPIFSQRRDVHDRIAGRAGALADALSGIRELAALGMGVEVEVPIISRRLQDLTATVELVRKVAPNLRAARFFVAATAAHPAVAPPDWTHGAEGLAHALRACRAAGVAVKLTSQESVPLCALREHEDLFDVYAFHPTTKVSGRSDEQLGEVCRQCAVRDQCVGIVAAYRAAHAEAGLQAYERKPAAMYEQRTTPRRTWTSEQRASASKAEIQVLRPTVNCNQDCTFCSANETSGNVWVGREEMLRAIARVARRGTERLSFSGGEPTLSKHLPEFVRSAARLGVPKIELITNAVLLDRRERVTALVDAGLTHAFVSLHAHSEELSQQLTQKVGDFDRTLAGVRNLLDAGVETALNHVITARNFPFLTRYVELVRERFEGRVKISFAFVTPQFKALDNIDVVPRLSDVMPHLKRAMYRALELRQPFNVGSRQGVPFCFLGEFVAWSDGIKQSNAARAEDAPQKQRSEACDRCRFTSYCNGLWRPYAGKYGLGELQPVPGEPLTAGDAEAIHLGERAWAWGVPMSFEELPEVLRRPELETGPPAVDESGRREPPSFTLRRSRPLRLAMLGTGKQARRLVRAIRNVEGLSVDALASPHALDADLRELGECPVYDDAAAALDDIRPDAVVIAASTRAHAPLVRLAVDRGVPVLLEKPVAATEVEAAELCELAARTGVLVVPAHNSLHASGLDRLGEMTARDAVISYAWRRERGSSDSMRTWNRSFLFETIYHVLAVIGGLCGGEGEVVQAAVRGDDAPAGMRLVLDYSGRRATVTLDFAAGVEEDIVMASEPLAGGATWTWRRQGRSTALLHGAESVALESRGSDVERMLENFRDAVLGRAIPRTSLTAALSVMRTAYRVLDAVAAAGAPFERVGAPRHVSSRGLGVEG